MKGLTEEDQDGLLDTHVDWKTFKLIFLCCPALFVIVAILSGSWTTAIPLTLLGCVIGALFVFRRGRPRAVTLHIAIGALLIYQTWLLGATTGEPNIGIVWFLAVPAVVALLGNRAHILFWTPITLGVTTYCWSLYAHYPSMAHPLTLANLIAATLTISAASFGVILQRDRREKALTEALRAAREEAQERRQAQLEASNSRAAITTFLASMSHELRTPLTSIVLASDVLAKELKSSDQTVWVQNIRQSAESLVLLLNDVLDLARGDAGQKALTEQPFDVEELLGGVAAIIRPMAVSREVDLLIGAMPQVPRRWNGDAARIRQVLVNLLSNSLHHASATRVWLRVTRLDDGVHFAVGDNGRGIDAAVQREIFQPFFQLPAQAGEPEKKGTGLGLAIAAGYVDAMGGELKLDSAPGSGAEFSFSLAAQGEVSDALITGYPSSDQWPSTVCLLGHSDEALAWAAAWLNAWDIGINESAVVLTLDRSDFRSAGSVTWLRERLDKLSGGTSTPAPVISKATPEAQHRGQCVICDDDPLIVSLVCHSLQQAGYTTAGFEAPEAMLEYLTGPHRGRAHFGRESRQRVGA